MVRDRWRAVVGMVMKLGHLSNCQLLDRKFAPWIYMKRPWEFSCKTWRHTQHPPEHAVGRQAHTERPQQCLLVAKKDPFSDILQEPFRSPPIQDWYSVTRGMLNTILNLLRPVAHSEEGGLGCSNPHPPEILKSLQNRAKLNPIVKTITNCWI